MATTASMSIGIMQGRLSNKLSQPLQSFPWETWRDEFSHAESIGFDLIEWLVDEDNNVNNPISTSQGRAEIVAISDASGVGVHTLCAHTFINGNLLAKGRLSEKARSYLDQVLDWANSLGVEKVVLPVMDAMSLRPSSNRDCMADILEKTLSGEGVELLLESDLPAKELLEFVNDVGQKRLGVLYDLGNANAMGFDATIDLTLLGSLVREVHMKDRNASNGVSQRLGDGGTPFAQVWQTLRLLDWQGPVVLETPVFDNWQLEAKHNFLFTQQWMSNTEYSSL